MADEISVKISEIRKEEVIQLRRDLVGWGITLGELVKISPKNLSSKKACSRVIDYILSEEMILNYAKKRKELPLIAVQKKTNISKRTIKKYEKYILAVAIIKTGNYSYIKDYLLMEMDIDIDVELNKGIVLGKKYGYATVMSKDGNFINVKDKFNYKEGYEFNISPIMKYLSKLFQVKLSFNSLFQ